MDNTPCFFHNVNKIYTLKGCTAWFMYVFRSGLFFKKIVLTLN